jgi:hypothetical protein
MRYDRLRRGFDQPDGWLPAFALPTAPAAPLSRRPLTEKVRGSLAAIEALAGW